MDLDVFFIDKNGDKVYDEKICSHIGLAMKYIEDHPELKEELKKHERMNEVQFLRDELGFLQGGTSRGVGILVYNSKKITDKQKQIVMYYYEEEGYHIENEKTFNNNEFDRDDR